MQREKFAFDRLGDVTCYVGDTDQSCMKVEATVDGKKMTLADCAGVKYNDSQWRSWVFVARGSRF